MHDHCCAHTLKFCQPCDTVYCESCKQEWKKPQYFWHWTYPYIHDTNPTPTITWTSHTHN